ncbi:hypothetical protein TrLO_g13239 [Triparma laevis f. longispina]|nr:hypothetical protein TrLO_g13239 [Triparma laevis f. longispina]
MPLAAVLAMTSLMVTVHLLYSAYYKLTFAREKGKVQQEPRGWSFIGKELGFLACAVLAYAYCVGQIEAGNLEVFNPHEILSVGLSANVTIVKRAYKKLSLKHHPDKGGDSATFQQIAKAYKALSDPESMNNYEKYGHPDGPQTATLSFAAPDWLLKPTGATAGIMILMYIGMFVGIIVYAWRYFNTADVQAKVKADSQSVAQLDMQHLAMGLNENSTSMDILWWVATTPENVMNAKNRIQEIENAKKQRKAEGGLDLSAGGWADDEAVEGESREAAQQRKMKAEHERKMVQQMAGKNVGSLSTEKIEGVDEGVVGIEWVKGVLEELGAWPPKIPCLTAGTSSYVGALPNGPDGKPVDLMASPPVRRNMIMMIARLNSMRLNTHPVLQQAAQKGLIDGSYFQESLKFRMKVSLLFEACLRVATHSKKIVLARTIVETVAMYKMGVKGAKDPASIAWFKKSIIAQYGSPSGLPSLKLHKAIIETEDEDEIACNDVCTLKLDLERTHANIFTEKKIEICQKQGLNVQEHLSKYREMWWVLVSVKDKNLKKVSQSGKSSGKNAAVKKLLEDHEESKKRSLVLAWPVIVQQIDRERTTVNIKFRAPPAAGEYTFTLDIKSQEFLDCDVVKDIVVNVVDESTVQKAEVNYGLDDEPAKKDQGEEEKEDDDEDSDSDEDTAKMKDDGDVVVVSSPKNSDLRQRKGGKK